MRAIARNFLEKRRNRPQDEAFATVLVAKRVTKACFDEREVSNMEGLEGAMEKLKQIMSTDEGQAGIQNFISNLKGGAESNGDNGGGFDISKLGSLLGNFGGGGNAESFDTIPENDEPFDMGSGTSNDNDSPFGNIDPEMMMKMGKMFSMMNGGGGLGGGMGGGGNRHASMLNSLKPYLSDERKGKLEMASKLMSLAKFAPLMKDMM